MNHSRQKILLKLSLFLTLIVAITAGWRDVGIDRGGYILMYDNIVSSEDIVTKFFFAKDALFLFAVTITNQFSNDARWAFLAICLFSIITKYLFVRRAAPEYALSYIVLYSIYISPGLEFAAMRGGLGIGFLMLALAYREKIIYYVIFSVLAIAAHSSIILVIPLGFVSINRFIAKNQIVYIIIALLIFLMSPLLLSLFPHGADYESNQGSVFAFLMPAATLIISLFIFHRLNILYKSDKKNPIYDFLVYLRSIIYGLIAIAFGMINLVVVASGRYLEISLCLLLFSSLILYKKSYLSLLGLLLLLAYLSYMQSARMTWSAIIN